MLGRARPYQVISRLQTMLQNAEGLAHQTPEAVAVHCARPRMPAGDYSEARTAYTGQGMQLHADTASSRLAARKHGRDLRLTSQSLLTGEAEPGV